MKKRILFALDGYDEMMHKGVLDYAKEHGWKVKVVNDDYGPVYRSWEGDGIISCLDKNDLENDMTKFVVNYRCPKVELAKRRLDESFGRVYEDNRAIGYMAAEYFINKGFRHFHYTAVNQIWHVEERCKFYKERLKRQGFGCSDWFLRRDVPDWNCLIDWIAEEIVKLPRPLAVFCGFDLEAEWIIEACMKAGVAVPDDIAVLGTGNHEMVCDWAEVAISSVNTNLRGWSYRAAELLEQILDGKASTEDVVLVPPLGIVERASTDIMAVNDERVADAIKFIKDNLSTPLAVDDVVQAADVPKTTLNRRFQRAFGHGINKEINRIKIEAARKMLADKDKNTVEIAMELGFSTPYYFYRVFKQQTGITPVQYREQLYGTQAKEQEG